MDAILKTACDENIKNSSFKNYKSISIKLFNIINKNDYNENMNDEEIMTGFGKVINKFETLQKYLEDEKNAFKTTTKKNYINNLLNVILKINDIDKFCIKKKKRLEEIKLAIKTYWHTLRKDLEVINLAKKNKDNEIEKSNTESEEEEEEKLQPIIEEEPPIVELTSIEMIEKLLLRNEIKKLKTELSMLEYEKSQYEMLMKNKIGWYKKIIEEKEEIYKT
jgi:hypothetical protein